MSDRYHEFNPEVEQHQQLAAAIVDVIDEDDRKQVPTGDIHRSLMDRGWASDTDSSVWSPGWLRALITYARPYLIDQGQVKTTEKQEQGNPTHYWEVVE
jgi:hypothetical protein